VAVAVGATVGDDVAEEDGVAVGDGEGSRVAVQATAALAPTAVSRRLRRIRRVLRGGRRAASALRCG